MVTYVVGIPKSGSNAVEKAIRLHGHEPHPHIHTANYHLAESNKVVFVHRHPRNVLISALRYKTRQQRGWRDEITEEKMIETFFDFFNAPLDAVYRGYERWLTSQAHIVRFVDLISKPAVIDGIADYLEVQRNPLAFGQLFGDTPTWSGELSRWQDHWTEGMDAVWRDEGMLDVEKRWGYSGS